MRILSKGRILYHLRGGDRLAGSVDEESARRFHFALALFLGWVLAMTLLVIPVFAVRKVAGEGLAVFIGCGTWVAMLLLRNSRPRAAARVFLCSLWALFETFSALNGGVHSSAGSMALVVFLAAAWLLGLRAALIFAGMTTLVALAEALMEQAGHPLPLYFPGAPIVIWCIELGIFVLTVNVIAGFMDRLGSQLAALRDSEARFRSLSDAAIEGVMVHEEGVIIDCNMAFARMFGYQGPDDLIGRNGPEFMLTPESRARIQLRMKHREEGILAVTGVRRDGSLFPAETESKAFRYRGRDTRLVAISDITERKRAEDSVRESEERFRTLAESSMVGIYIVVDGRYEYVNPAFATMFGYSITELMGLGPLDLVHPDDHALAGESIRRRVTGEVRSVHYEFKGRRKDGEVNYIEVYGTWRESKNRVALVGTLIDITERKQAENQRDHLQYQLAQAHRMESIGRLAGGVAHDFNNMLTVILGYAAMAKSGMPPQAPQIRHLAEVVKAANRAKDITQQLLGFSRQQIIAPAPTNLNDLLADLLAPLATLIGEDIELSFHPGRPLSEVLVDHSQVNQILLNLAANARDAMPNGGKLTIETENRTVSDEYSRSNPEASPGQYVVLAASDSGVGMDADTQARIFEPFFTTKEKAKGTGLGLAMVYGIVKQNGGFVGVHSEVGRGTTFRIYFPQLQGEARSEKASPQAEAMPSGEGTILLVEDDDLVREMVASSLEGIGYTPLVAMNPAQAIAICSSEAGRRIRLVLSDVVMPGMNGMELRDRICEVRPGMPVLFMSGYTSNVIVKQGVLKPGVHFIQKPFAIDELGRRLEEVLG